MNILLTTTVYEEAGGTKNLIDDMGKIFREKKHSVNIISVFPRYEKNILFQGPLKNILYMNNIGDINILNTIDHFLKAVYKHKPDRIYFFLGHGALLLLVAALPEKYKSRSILFYLDPWFTIPELKNNLENYSHKYKMLRDKLASREVTIHFWKKIRPFELLAGHDAPTAEFHRSVRNIILCTNDMIDYFNKNLYVPLKKIKYVPLYTRSSGMSVASDRRVKKLNTGKESKRLIFMGRVSSSWKGFWILLEALKKLLSFELSVYTVSPSEILLAKQLLEHYGIDQNRVKFFLGKKDREVFKAMREADVLVLPSLAEGFSFVMVECMGSGGIIIAGPVYGGPLEVIKDGLNGFIYQAGSSDGLVDVLGKVNNLSSDDLKKIKVAARKRAKEYSFELFWSRLSKGESY